MAKKSKVVTSAIVSASLVAGMGMAAYAVPEKPSGDGGSAPSSSQSGGSSQGGNMVAPGGSSSASVSYSGATTFSADTTASDATYNSSTGGQNALLVSGGTVNLNKITVTKSGDESSENSDFYGTNAGILAYENGKVIIGDATISTGGAHANAVFAYGSGAIEISNSTINTTGNNSGGVMVTGGGTLKATDLTVETAGNSSAAIRSDRGGGTMTIVNGEYKTNGVGSPAIYSTADVNVKGAKLEATVSEGVVIEGANSVALEETTVESTNTQLNGKSETYKNIFIYQSMSGDADEGVGTFTAKDSTLTSNKGEQFFVTNTSAVINLENNTYNSDSESLFLLAQASAWGTSGKNGGNVSLNLMNDEVKGDMQFDDISSLTLNLSGGSYLRGMMVGGTKNVKISDASSVWVLEGDVELEFLEDADTTFQNIYSNGHTLKVNGEVVPVNAGTPPEHKAGTSAIDNVPVVEIVEIPKTDEEKMWEIVIACLAGAGFIAVVVTFIVMVATYNRPSEKERAVQDANNMVK